MLKRLALTVALLCIAAAVPSAENWPQWRGPSLNGVVAFIVNSEPTELVNRLFAMVMPEGAVPLLPYTMPWWLSTMVLYATRQFCAGT